MKSGLRRHSLFKDLLNVVLLWLLAVFVITLGVLITSGLPVKMFPLVFFNLIFSPYIPAFFIFVFVAVLYSAWAIWWRGAVGPEDRM